MRKVIRSTPTPSSLAKRTVPKLKKDKNADPAAVPPPRPPAMNELERATAHFALPLPLSGKRPAFSFKAYKANNVRTRLLQDFYDKCAYCESRYSTTSPVDVEHFRPKGRIKGEKGDGYWWLAMSWDNLLPSCIDCNRHRTQQTAAPPEGTGNGPVLKDDLSSVSWKTLTTGKQDAFPITGTRLAARTYDYDAEGALLLDPCRDEPNLHLHFHIDATAPLGLVLPKADTGPTTRQHLILTPKTKTTAAIQAHAAHIRVSARGAVSIQTYGLNRIELIRERTRVLRRLEFFGRLLVRATGIIEELHAPFAHPECKARNDKAIAGLRAMRAMVISQIRELAKEDAPYSAMVKAWVKDFRHGARSAPRTRTAP